MLIKALAFLVIVLVNAGCSYIMPPQKIPMDRRNYVDAVSTSWKEQLLTNLVKLRYGDTLTFLEMTSVNTSYELGGNLSAAYTTPWHFLFGTTGARNTFTGSGAVTYLDRPTISYAPIRGENLTKTLIMPIDPGKILKGLQTGWRPQYILTCCVKSINNLQNPQDEDFIILSNLAQDLSLNGIIRITIDEAKGPTKYDITVHMKDKICPEKEQSEPGKKPGGQVATTPQKGKEDGGTDKKEEEKGDSAIGLVILDKNRVKFLDKTPPKSGEPTFKKKIELFEELLWSGASPQGKPLYSKFQAGCPKPVDFTESKFWTGDTDQKIIKAIKACKAKFDDGKIKALTAYIKQTFGRYAIYKIIDGNQQPRPLDPNCDKIYVQTRSILQVFTYLAEFIQVPAEHLAQNRTKERSPYVEAKNAPLGFNIKCDKVKPGDSFVAVQKNDYWFYIDDKDFDSKKVFSGIAGILSLSEPGTKEGTPVLTLPVQ